MKELEIYSGDFTTELRLDYADGGIFCGFPSPAQDYVDRSLDFNRELIQHPSATFYAKVKGDSMVNAGIEEGDILVIDRAVEAEDGDIVVAYINQEFTVKYLDISKKNKGVVCLRPANPKYKPIKLKEGEELLIWGVVISVIKRFR